MGISKIIAKAEQAVEQRAAHIAYQMTDNITDRVVQKTMYQTYKEAIILGARFMQEELMNLTDKNHEA